MIYLLLWFICSIASFYLLKNYITSNLTQVGVQDASIAIAMRNAAKKDASIEEIYNTTDSVINASFWTVILVIHLAIWPICLIQLTLWQTIDKQDFSDFRG
jgi:hypothetical protein